MCCGMENGECLSHKAVFFGLILKELNCARVWI